MTAILIVACVGLTAGFFMLFGIESVPRPGAGDWADVRAVPVRQNHRYELQKSDLLGA